MLELAERQDARIPRTTRDDIPTPLVEIEPGLLAKFECNNPGGSHKVRAARYIVRQGLEDGSILPGVTTVIEKTGGNFGFGLTVACEELGIPVELAVGLSFSPIKRKALELCGAKLIGLDMLHAGSTPRQVVEWQLEQAVRSGKHYFYTDQFKNPGSLAAHELGTGPEIAAQLKQWPELEALTFVSCAGTGASLTGVTRALRARGVDTQVVLVEPAGCDSLRGVFAQHSLEGMSVGVVPPFIDWATIGDVRQVSAEQADREYRRIARQHGFFVGRTSAACLHVASDLARTQPTGRKILAMIYDHGLWYPPPDVP